MDTSILIQNLTVDDLCNRIRSTIQEELQRSSTLKEENSQYLTRSEVASLLKISIPTLHSYTKKGKLTAYRIGRRVLYRSDELETNLEMVSISRYGKIKKQK